MSALFTLTTWRPIACAAALAFGALPVQAEDLMELFQAARQYDAGYLAAKADAAAAQARADQASALMRPSVGLQGSLMRNRFESSAPANPLQPSVATYTAAKGGLAARQPLLNLANMAQVDQAEQARLVAEADLEIAENDLIVRVTEAYFDVLAAQDVLDTTLANKKALEEQLAAAKRSFEVGNATITDTREAQARYDLATAQEIAATNDLRVKRIALDQLVGGSNVQPNPLQVPARLDSLASGEMDEWVNRSSQAPLVRKAELGLKVADLDIDRAKAGHLPTVDLVANLARTHVSSRTPALVQSSAGAGTAGAVGLELNMPLYAGNAVQNQVREALALQERARQDVDNARRSVALGARQAYLGVQSGLAQVQAYEAAEASAKLALEATQLGYKVGVRINKDVLDAQTQLANTQKDLYKARYDVIVAAIKLKQVSGTLSTEDLNSLNQLLIQR